MPVTQKVESCPIQGKFEYTGECMPENLLSGERGSYFAAPHLEVQPDSTATSEQHDELSNSEDRKLYKIRIKQPNDTSIIERNNFGPLRWTLRESDFGPGSSFDEVSEEVEETKIGNSEGENRCSEDEIEAKLSKMDTDVRNNNRSAKKSQIMPSGLDFFDVARLQHRNQVPRFSNPYLRPKARFKGQQISEKGTFDVHVELKTVDLVNSLVTGFLQIWGLTVGCRVITTFFKGEIINNPLNKFDWRDDATPADCQVRKYSFLTENKDWGSCVKNDFEHWEILTRRDTLDFALREKLQNIQTKDHKNQFVYMRWKEEFLVPDSRIKQISGASFEGFYYIVLNIGDGRGQKDDSTNALSLPGSISGLYYHQVSDKLQALTLEYIDDQTGSNSEFEFC